MPPQLWSMTSGGGAMETMWSQKERDTSREWVYYLVLVVIIGIASGLALFLVINPSSKSWFNGDKSFEITTQFVFVVIIGGAVAVAYHEMEARRATNRQR